MEGVALLLEVLAAPFHAVDDRQHQHDIQAELFRAVGCKNRAAAGGDDIFDDDDLHAGRDGAFDVLLGAVALGLLPHQEPGQVAVLLGGDGEHPSHDGVGSDRHAADGLGVDPLHQGQQALTHESQPLRVQCDLLPVEVVRRLLARGQGEVAELEGAFAEECDEGGHEGGG